jgi:hypothetical protein
LPPGQTGFRFQYRLSRSGAGIVVIPDHPFTARVVLILSVVLEVRRVHSPILGLMHVIIHCGDFGYDAQFTTFGGGAKKQESLPGLWS